MKQKMYTKRAGELEEPVKMVQLFDTSIYNLILQQYIFLGIKRNYYWCRNGEVCTVL